MARFPSNSFAASSTPTAHECINRFKVNLPKGGPREYAYARYFFTNLSADIRALFCTSCDQLGIRWTQSSFKNISVADRQSVALP